MLSRRDPTTGFDVVNVVLLTIVAAACLVPMVHVLALSFSAEGAILSGRVGLVPVGFQLRGYLAVFESAAMIRALAFTVYLTILGTSVNVMITALGAYSLSKPDLVGRRVIWLLILFTMFFSGGLIPLYMVVRSLGLLDSVWALILPGAIGTFNLILMKTYFSGIPASLAESARMDGCSEIRILMRIILPLSTPIIATLTLFYGVGHWSQYFQALIYIQDPDKYTLQLRLQQLIKDGAGYGPTVVFGRMDDVPVESVKSRCHHVRDGPRARRVPLPAEVLCEGGPRRLPQGVAHVTCIRRRRPAGPLLGHPARRWPRRGAGCPSRDDRGAISDTERPGAPGQQPVDRVRAARDGQTRHRTELRSRSAVRSSVIPS